MYNGVLNVLAYSYKALHNYEILGKGQMLIFYHMHYLIYTTFKNSHRF